MKINLYKKLSKKWDFRIMYPLFYSFWILWIVFGNFLPIFGEELRSLPEARIPLDEGKKLEPGELAEKREGWYVTAVPLLSSDPVRGQGGGIRASLFFNGKKTDLYYEYEAYRSKLTFQLFQTNEGVKNHFIQFDSPYIYFKYRVSMEE